MSSDWGVIGCGYMAKEYCKVLTSKGVKPKVYSRVLDSENVLGFRALFPNLDVELIENSHREVDNWLVLTNIESHDEICSRLSGNIYCEKPYSHDTGYDVNRNVSVLLNRRYYYWVKTIKKVIDAGKIVKIVATIPESSVNALITQSIHVIDLLWYLTGRFDAATSLGDASPSYFMTTQSHVPLVINMNYGSHENFSIRFYSGDGLVYEAKPLETFNVAEGMEVRQPDDDIPFRSYKPVIRAFANTPTVFKPGLEELVDDLLRAEGTRLPGLEEHHEIHAWMEENMR